MHLTTHRRGRRTVVAATLAVAALGSAATEQALALNPGDVLVSEFRTSGLNNNDEYVEVYNNTGDPIDLSTLTVVITDGTNTNTQTLGAGMLNGRRTTLVTRVAPDYTLGNYAVGDTTFATGVGNTAGVRVREGATVLDQVSTSALPLPVTGGNNSVSPEGAPLANAGVSNGAGNLQQYAYVRKLRNSGTPSAGRPLDTDNNATDFDTVSTDSQAGRGVGIFGAPNPQNQGDPRQRNNNIAITLLDGETNQNVAPSRSFDAAADPDNAGPAVSRLRIRREITNNGANPITALRIRVVDITTLRSPGDSAGQARIRLLSSGTISGACPAPCVGANLQQAGGVLTPTDDPATAADETVGGTGLYSSATVNLAGPLAPGASTNVEFRLGVERAGAFRFFFNLEAQ